MIILVGMPACGKSSFCKRKMIPHGYIHINRDALKTQIKCVQVNQTLSFS